MPNNPITGQHLSRAYATMLRAEREAPVTSPKRKALDAQDMVANGERRGLPPQGAFPSPKRWLQVAGFSLGNFLSLGALGRAGSQALRDVRSGKEVSAAKLNLAKNYAYASEGKHKWFNACTKVYSKWIGPIGLIERTVRGAGRMIENKSAAREQFAEKLALRENLESDIAKEFGTQIKFDSVKKFNSKSVPKTHAQFKARLKDELYRDDTGQTCDKANKTRLLNGSKQLQAAFVNFCEAERSDDNVHMQKWLGPNLDKVDPSSSQFDPTFGMNKAELLRARDTYILPDRAHAHEYHPEGQALRTICVGGEENYSYMRVNINESENVSKPWAKKIDAALGDFPQRYYTLKKEIDELKAQPLSLHTWERMARAEARLHALEQETITPKQSQGMKNEMIKAEHGLMSNIGDSAQRFTTSIDVAPNQGKGKASPAPGPVKPREERSRTPRAEAAERHWLKEQSLLPRRDEPANQPTRARRYINGFETKLANQLQNAGMEPRTAKLTAKRHFAGLDRRVSDCKGRSPDSKLIYLARKLEQSGREKVNAVQIYQDELQKLENQAVEKMKKMGSQPSMAEHYAKRLFAQARQKVPSNTASARSVLKHLDKTMPTKVAINQQFQENLRDKRRWFTVDLQKKGVSTQDMDVILHDVFDDHLAKMPDTAKEANSAIEQVSLEMDEALQNAKPASNVNVFDSIQMNGTAEQIKYDHMQLGALSDHANASLNRALTNPDDEEWSSTNATENQDVGASFLRDFEGTHISVGHKDINKPGHMPVREQQQNARKNLIACGVKEKDMKVVTGAVNQGIGALLQGLDRSGAGPVKALFGDDNSKEFRQEDHNLTIHIEPHDDGTYGFTFTNKSAIDNVYDAQTPQNVKRLDPATSWRQLEVKGTIDPAAKGAHIRFVSAKTDYEARQV